MFVLPLAVLLNSIWDSFWTQEEMVIETESREEFLECLRANDCPPVYVALVRFLKEDSDQLEDQVYVEATAPVRDGFDIVFLAKPAIDLPVNTPLDEHWYAHSQARQLARFLRQNGINTWVNDGLGCAVDPHNIK